MILICRRETACFGTYASHVTRGVVSCPLYCIDYDGLLPWSHLPICPGYVVLTTLYCSCVDGLYLFEPLGRNNKGSDNYWRSKMQELEGWIQHHVSIR